ncbi:hypothetical protein GCM10010425_22850 [Streptomyces spororaveus]
MSGGEAAPGPRADFPAEKTAVCVRLSECVLPRRAGPHGVAADAAGRVREGLDRVAA